MSNLFNQPLTRRNLVIVVASLAALALLSWGGGWVYRKASGRPPTTAEVRKQIWKYLRQQSHRDEFQIADWTALTNFTVAAAPEPANSPPVAAELPRVKLGKQDKQIKVRPLKTKRLPPIQSGVSSYFREKQKEAASYEAIYRFIGEELWVAGQMFAHSNSSMQQAGVVLASEAAHYALSDAENGWLAARICEGYLWPSLDLIEQAERPVTTPDQLLAICEAAFEANGETSSLIRNYEYMIAKTPKRADKARVRLAILYEQAGDLEKALRTLQEIKDPQIGKVQARIAALKERLRSSAGK